MPTWVPTSRGFLSVGLGGGPGGWPLVLLSLVLQILTARFQFGCSRFSSKGTVAIFCSNLHAIEDNEQKPGFFSA